MAIYELALFVTDKPGSGAKTGDCITIRDPLGYIGQSERDKFLWLVIDSDLPMEMWVQQDTESGRKRETYVDLEELNQNGFNFEMDYVYDPTLEYQPGIDPDPSTGIFRKNPVPLKIDHLLRTKE